MRRKLLGAEPLVKQRPAKYAVMSAKLGLIAAWMLGWGPAACGGAPARPQPPPGYGARVADCIDAPRPLNDAAQARMLAVPAGPAVEGSSAKERAQARLDYGRGGERLFEDEVPLRRAYVHGFRMDISPVTGELYAEFVAACGAFFPDAESLSAERWAAEQKRFGLRYDYAQIQRFLWPDRSPREERAKHPMVLVSEDDAAFYCAWRGARLPSEDEWERAARGATGNIYPWGNRYDPFRVNTTQRGAKDTLDVGSLPQGNAPEGFTDMGGMVLEWTSTPWSGRISDAVVKGNAWDGRGGFGRGAARRALPKAERDVTVGFRCAADP
jgi:formylglycine-generating enzyme required for sulfatase activity